MLGEMSQLIVEAAIYMHFVLYDQWDKNSFSDQPIRFLNFFYALLDGALPKYKMIDEYAALRGDLKLHDKSFRTNVFTEQAQLFGTTFKNNFVKHAFPRLQRFLRRFEKDRGIVRETLLHLFAGGAEKKKYLANAHLISKMKEHLHYKDNSLHDIYLCHKHIELFYRLQSYNEKEGLKNFSLVPIFHHGLHHIAYDSRAFWQLLCRLELYEGR